ncbi:helix-turn-helix domain-containing protein [Paenibacillus chondroitinus]|uniref:Helix-turn-helix domain-containing protein n=1 Tax=Paenibacillus chondroitinus TaxID=59842 RepID=A0ABU6DMU5_9BACL|nr:MULTISPECIES: helix-turn-helix domain-containing protein [Paenibacillus]MCY9661488.1 helix-turn-helix transcriptional regulator [Paenibacillus anseongense]MEB4798650.1 helix-turn-helix domain-containing protein [Paenibacillus chondroitinus]
MSDLIKPSLGIMNLQQTARKFQLSRVAPSEDLAFFIRHYWIIRWDLRGQEPYTQHVIPNPCVNLVVEPDRTAIYGPGKEKYGHYLEGHGCVFGVKFKPGGFYPFFKRPVSAMQEGPLGVQSVFDTDPRRLETDMFAQTDESQMVALIERMIRPKLPEQDAQVAFINEIIDYINEQPDITKVDSLCEHFHVNKRTLQRLFDHYVGVTPKWVIKLARIQNAAEMTDVSVRPNWSKLSMDLGYHDQSHFIKDFKSIIGQTPDEYARQAQ